MDVNCYIFPAHNQLQRGHSMCRSSAKVLLIVIILSCQRIFQESRSKVREYRVINRLDRVAIDEIPEISPTTRSRLHRD